MKALFQNYNDMPRIVVDRQAARMMPRTFCLGDHVSVDTNARPRFALDSGVYCLHVTGRQKRLGTTFVFAHITVKRRAIVLSYDNPRFRPRTIPGKQVPELPILGRARIVGRAL